VPSRGRVCFIVGCCAHGGCVAAAAVCLCSVFVAGRLRGVGRCVGLSWAVADVCGKQRCFRSTLHCPCLRSVSWLRRSCMGSFPMSQLLSGARERNVHFAWRWISRWYSRAVPAKPAGPTPTLRTELQCASDFVRVPHSIPHPTGPFRPRNPSDSRQAALNDAPRDGLTLEEEVLPRDHPAVCHLGLSVAPNH